MKKLVVATLALTLLLTLTVSLALSSLCRKFRAGRVQRRRFFPERTHPGRILDLV